jgi:hypothetical protein
MSRTRRISALGVFGVLTACTMTSEAPRAVVVAAVGQVVEAIATETTQRQGTEALRGLPVVVRSAGPELVIAELLRTRLVERATAVEVACPAKCLEISLLEFVMETSAPPPNTVGQLLPVNAGAIPGLSGPPRAPNERGLAPGHASALLVTFATRDGNRYSGRQQLVAVVAVAKAP